MNNTKYEMWLMVIVRFVILISGSSFPEVCTIPFRPRKVTSKLKPV